MTRSTIKTKTLESELKELRYCANVAKSKNSFHGLKTYGPMAEIFGVRIQDESLAKKFISRSSIELFREQRETILKEKYASRKFIREQSEDATSYQEARSISVEIVEDRTEDNFGVCECSDSCKVNEILHQSSERILNSIYKKKTKNQKVDLLPPEIADQIGCAKRLFENIWYKNTTGQLLIAPAGSGKTFILANVLANLLEAGIVERSGSISPWPIFYVTAASLVAQTRYDVLEDKFGLDCVNTIQVVNIEFFRTKFGGLLVKRDIVVVGGEEEETFTWVPNLLPAVIIWDESQMLAREQAIQTKIACALKDAEAKSGRVVYQIDSSATPGSRVCEFKHFVVASGVEFDIGGNKVKVTNANWSQFARQIASPFDPEEYSVEAVKQLMDYMEPYVVRIAAINPPFKAYNSVMALRFRNKEEHDYYYTALKRYEEEKARLEGDDNLSAGQLRIALLATFTILRKAAEHCKIAHIAEWMDKTYRSGFAPLVVVAFKGTITGVVRLLIEEYGWSRQDISLIWGGSTETLSKKKKLAKKIKENQTMMEEILGELDINLEDLGIKLDELDVKTDEQLAFEKLHGLTSQSREERERERKRFQSQASRGMLITFKAGGKGLSAHHEAEYKNAKPRRVFLSPVYSEKELIQGLGRGPRITSISDTYQVMGYYEDTIEEEVKDKVVLKMQCAREVSRMRESWEDLITKRKVFSEADVSDDTAVEVETDNLLGTYVEPSRMKELALV